jgi:hypothetical protein
MNSEKRRSGQKAVILGLKSILGATRNEKDLLSE